MSADPMISQRGVPSPVLRVLHSGRVWTIQGLGTLLWLALAYAWLWIREAKWWHLAGSALLALFLLYLAAFLQRTALRVYRRVRISGMDAAFGRRTIRRRAFHQWLPGAVLVALLFAALVWLSIVLQDALPVMTQRVASWLTLHLRRPVDPYRLETRAEALFFVGPWFQFVVFWLPLAAAALLGEPGLWRSAARAWRKWRYWLSTLACVAIGYLSFSKLAEWVPRVRGIAGQSASMFARLLLGYVIALGAWLVILALVEEAIAPATSPDETQDLTPG
jgi:hypothetical protein